MFARCEAAVCCSVPCVSIASSRSPAPTCTCSSPTGNARPPPIFLLTFPALRPRANAPHHLHDAWTSRQEEAEQMVADFLATGNNELDSAFMYTGGKSEQMIGRMPAFKSGTVQVATKANPVRSVLCTGLTSAHCHRHRMSPLPKTVERQGPAAGARQGADGDVAAATGRRQRGHLLSARPRPQDAAGGHAPRLPGALRGFVWRLLTRNTASSFHPIYLIYSNLTTFPQLASSSAWPSATTLPGR